MVDQLKFGLFGLHRDSNVKPSVLVRRARLAEEAELESLWVGDHIDLPPGENNPPRLEALIVLTYLAAVTTRIRLGAGLIVLPQRQPVLLAKQLTSLDVLSHGRLTGVPDLDTVRRYADLGVHRLVVHVEGIDDGAVDSVIGTVGSLASRI